MNNLSVMLKEGSALAGLFLLVVGVGVGSAFGWTIVPLILIAIGALASSAWLLTHQGSVASFFGLRSTQSNTNILVSVLAVAVILGVANFLGTRYEAKLDLTSEGFYSLAPQTVKIVQDLKDPVKVYAVTSNPSPPLREKLERYQKLNPKQFQFEFINPRRSPETTRQLNVTQDNTLVVEMGPRKQNIPPVNPLELESKLTPAILQLVRNENLSVYFVQGHGELPLSGGGTNPSLQQATTGLTQEGYSAKALNLVESEIPSDANVLVIAGPQRAFFPAEVDKVKGYLDKGGRVMLLLNPQLKRDNSDSLLGLGSLLESWGVKVENDVIVDVSQVGQMLGTGPSVALVTTYGAHPITNDLVRSQLMTFFPLARSLSTTATTGITATQILTTNNNSWGEMDPPQDNSQQIKFDANRDKQGPLGLGVALVHRLADTAALPTDTGSEKKPTEARFVVIGNANFAIDSNFGQQGNGDLFLNSVNWLADRGDLISIRAKTPTNRRFSLTEQNLSGLVVLAVFGLPLLALGSGIYVWWQRR